MPIEAEPSHCKLLPIVGNYDSAEIMKNIVTKFRFIVLFSTLIAAACAADYKLGPDSERKPGVPQGKVIHNTWKSRIFPGTARDYWVYVPAQYQSSKKTCVIVFQDGGGYV